MDQVNRLVATVCWPISEREVMVTIREASEVPGDVLRLWPGDATAAGFDDFCDVHTRIADGPLVAYAETLSYYDLLAALDLDGPGEHRVTRTMPNERDPAFPA